MRFFFIIKRKGTKMISKKGIKLSIIILLDLISTLVLLKLGLMTEFNPLMDWILSYGYVPFTLFKLIISAISITAIEYCVRKKLISKVYYDITIYSYIVLYITVFSIANF